METRGMIVLASWICATILSAIVIWISQQLNLWNAIFILLLIATAFIITYSIPFGLPATAKPTKRIEAQLTEISKQLQKLNEKVDYIRKQLEE